MTDDKTNHLREDDRNEGTDESPVPNPEEVEDPSPGDDPEVDYAARGPATVARARQRVSVVVVRLAFMHPF